MNRAFILLAVCLGLAATAGAQPGVLRLVVPGVWFRQGDMQFGHSNNAVIENADYLIVVDANYPSGAQALIGDIAKVSSTHHHPDHAYGNYLFTRIGATTIAYVDAFEEMCRYEPALWQQVTKERKDVSLRSGTHPGRYFRISSKGEDPRHRRCVVSWPNEIRAAQWLDVRYVFPGHGAYGGKEFLSGEVEFFETLYTKKESRPIGATLQLPDRITDVSHFSPQDLWGVIAGGE